MSKEELRSLVINKEACKPWIKPPFTVDSYANRHLAQQKILDQQQKQLKEQQRLIEELSYLQTQQMLQQRAQAQAQAHPQTTLLIDDLQKKLMEKNQHLENLQNEMEKSREEKAQ